jgi:hypothetical protein
MMAPCFKSAVFLYTLNVRLRTPVCGFASGSHIFRETQMLHNYIRTHATREMQNRPILKVLFKYIIPIIVYVLIGSKNPKITFPFRKPAENVDGLMLK